MPTRSPKRPTSATLPPSRSKPPSDDLAAGLGLASFLGGAAALLASAFSNQPVNNATPKPRYILGGVDLTDVDLSQPFWVDFSVPRTESIEGKRQAIERVRIALHEFHAAYPYWLCRILGSIDSEQFGIHVIPLKNISQGYRAGRNQSRKKSTDDAGEND
jgi:hypothetical protein